MRESAEWSEVTSPRGDASDNSPLPDAWTLARLVSNVTEAVNGTTFVPSCDDDSTRDQQICGRMFLLPFQGKRAISVVLFCDSTAAHAVASALYGYPREQLSREAIDDAVREMLNMVAGQIQRALHIDQQLGLPRPTSLAEISRTAGVGLVDSIWLTSDTLGDLRLWVFEAKGPGQPGDASRGWSGRFRSLFRGKKRP